MRLVRGLFGALLGVVVLGGAVGAAGGYVAWRHYSANLPDVDGLKNYQPPVMSRVFAGDGRLMAELATERRIFVPFAAIPDDRQAGLRLRRGPEFLGPSTASIRWRSPAPACST